MGDNNYNNYLSEGEQSVERESFFGVGEPESMTDYEEVYELLNEVTRPRPTATIWVTRDGQRVRVRAMSDSHLLNTIAMLRRNAEVKMMSDALSLGAYLDGDPPDGACDAASQAENELNDMDVDDYLEATCVTFPALLAEAERRELKL